MGRAWSTYPTLLSLFTFAPALSGLVGPPGATVLHEQGAIFLDSAPYGLLACALLGLPLPIQAFAVVVMNGALFVLVGIIGRMGGVAALRPPRGQLIAGGRGRHGRGGTERHTREHACRHQALDHALFRLLR